MSWALLLLAALWAWILGRELHAALRLPSLPPRRDRAPIPSATIVMAVRDDAAHVAATVRGLLAQRHVDLQMVVVDDRSTDGTGAVLARIAADDPRLRITTVRELPADWLGKTHALHTGTADVTTRWILFTDADAHLAADTLARAIDAAERAEAHHVSLLPGHRGTTFAGRVCLLAFHLTVLRRVAAVNGRRQRGFVGTGAFNLVRTDAYRAVGGHLPLRLEVVDDVWLGCLLWRAGYRSRVWLAPHDFAVDWGASPLALLRVVEKNMFAVLRYRTMVAVAAALFGCLLVAGPLLAPLAAPLGWLPFGCWLASGLGGAVFAHRMGWNAAAGLLTPLSRFWLVVALANSAAVTLRQRGVRWRGTFYPLPLLRRGQVP